ncbi:MAG TPA: hypothetical protein VL985_11355 [Stellaceae bacterium]|nr:hypothetical protein [Stellaceae bacterium]
MDGNRPRSFDSVWRRDLPLPIHAASLIEATLVAAPLALFYDLVLAGVAVALAVVAWLLRADGGYRLPQPAKPILAVLYVLTSIRASWPMLGIRQ